VADGHEGTGERREKCKGANRPAAGAKVQRLGAECWVEYRVQITEYGAVRVTRLARSANPTRGRSIFPIRQPPTAIPFIG